MSEFHPKVGEKCSFYHEGGHGERRWVIGWRCGIIREVPQRGKKAGQIRIEIPVDLWSQDLRTRKWQRKARALVWVESHDVNAPGDTTYHGPLAEEVAQERKARKAKEQAAADRRMRKSPKPR